MREKKAGIIVLIGCLVVMIATLAAGCAKDAEEEDLSEIQLSFVNEEYVLSGTGKPFVDVELAFVPEETDPYGSVLSALREPAEEGLVSMLSGDYKINSAKAFFGGGVLVDFSSEGLVGSSMQEHLLISQIVRTLYLTFDDIRNVQFTVDGKIADTLMGHMSIESPFVLTPYVDEDGEVNYVVEAEVQGGT